MSPIKSIYIPHVEKNIDAKFITKIFRKNGIAMLGRVIIKPYRRCVKNRTYNYNRAYIEIDRWFETESSYNFIKKLYGEARIIYSDDNWWVVKINTNVNVFDKNEDSYSNVAIGSVEEFYDDIDVEKTELLKKLVEKMKENEGDKFDIEHYLNEIDGLLKIDKERNDAISKRWVEMGSVKLFKNALSNALIKYY